MSRISIKQTIYDLVKIDPNIQNHLFELGFKDITKPQMIQTVGRFMTLRQGCQLKKINEIDVISYLVNQGYEVEENLDE